jgi:thymidylate synthase
MLPILKVEGKTLAEAWENSLLEVWEKGTEIKTEYDRNEDPPSKDAGMVMTVNEPFAEPRIHMCFPGGMEDLEKYRQEVVLGVHDHWINPEDKKWTYTYHARLFDYKIPGIKQEKSKDQIEYIAEKLSQVPFSRRAQAITWIPSYDPATYDPPCLQRLWCRIIEENKSSYLVMNAHWRSRDAYRAAFMNMFGLTCLQKYIADKISKKTGREIKIGRYVDISDSYHIYGESFHDFKNVFLNQLKKREFYNSDHSKSRTIRSDSEIAAAGFEYGRQLLEREKKTGKKGAVL